VCWKDTTARIKNFDPRVIMVLSRLEVSSIALVSAVDPLTRRSVPWVKRVGNGSVCGGVEMLIWRWVNIIAHRWEVCCALLLGCIFPFGSSAPSTRGPWLCALASRRVYPSRDANAPTFPMTTIV
jgi:hypothetical protein